MEEELRFKLFNLKNGCSYIKDKQNGIEFETLEDVVYLLNFQNQKIYSLEEDLKYLNWYKMWHEKFKKEIEDLKLELTDYRPTKLSGIGQCKCDVCGSVCWTNWFYEYRRKLVCGKCLKKMQGEE